MLLLILHELWSIIDDSGFVVSSVVSSHPALLAFHMLAGNLDRAPRKPNLGSSSVIKSWDSAKQPTVDASDVASWARLNEVELVAIPQWRQINLRIASISNSGSDALIVPQEPERMENLERNYGTLYDGESYF